MKSYDHLKIEPKWQKEWEKKKAFAAIDSSKKPKWYSLIEFPYPSGDGLHVGHVRSNTAMDIVSRKRRREGYNVLYPIGWDAFGLPTENYAIKTGIQPAVVTRKNADTFRRQLKSLGLSFDWSREINTTDPKYYRWTQWIFLQFLKNGLAYKKKMAINWCPVDLTGLANEEVVDGKCERCGATVEKREKEQWMLAITKYADKLLDGLDATDYVMPVIVDHVNPPRSDKPSKTRVNAHAIVYDPAAKKYLIIRNKKHGWDTVVIGGVEEGEDFKETAAREVREETGYTDLEYKRILGGPVRAEYFAKHKDENRIAITTGVYFELKSDARVAIGADEDKDNEILWIDETDFIPGKMVNSELSIWLERMKDPTKGWPKPLLDWPDFIKNSQRNWIGKSEGAEIEFAIKVASDKTQVASEKIKVFTTRPDTLFGVTYIVVAPEHSLVRELLPTIKNRSEILIYLTRVKKQSETERTDATREKTGVELKGIKAVNPVNGEEVPVYIADYVLADYGTGAVMAVPAHDDRDFAFAKKYNLSIIEVVKRLQGETNLPFTDDGLLINSAQFNGKKNTEVMKEITSFAGGQWISKFKLRDWVFSRQRYWGEPIPVVHCERCGIVPVPEKELPVKLPPVKNYKPTETGESPLAAISKWVNVKCPNCKGKGTRETDTMPNWAGSSWYYLRYTDPRNATKFADMKKLKYWTPVDWYNGGMEHVTLHLLYSRFWHKFLFDQGLVPTSEPYTKRSTHGFVLGPGGEKMSKSRGNVINPDTIVKNVGADSLRLYEMFMGPFDQAIAWDENGIVGCRRFLERVWKLQDKVTSDKRQVASKEKQDLQLETCNLKLISLIHKTIKKVSEDIENMRFNTAVSALMILLNELEKESTVTKENYAVFLQLLAPFAPHITEELWSAIGNKKSIHQEPWLKFDPLLLIESNTKMAVQINGKTRDEMTVAADLEEDGIKAAALALESVRKWLNGKMPSRIIIVKGRLINIVVPAV